MKVKKLYEDLNDDYKDLNDDERSILLEDDYNNFINTLEYISKDLDTSYYIAVGDVRRWNGSYKTYIYNERLEDLMKDILEDYNKVYLDSFNLQVIASHHDGSNYFTIKKIKSGASPEEVYNVLNAIDEGRMKEEIEKRYFRSLKKDIIQYFKLNDVITLSNININTLYHDVNIVYGGYLKFKDLKQAEDFKKVMLESGYFTEWLDIPLYDEKGIYTSFFMDIITTIDVVDADELENYIEEYEVKDESILFYDSGYNVAIINI